MEILTWRVRRNKKFQIGFWGAYNLQKFDYPVTWDVRIEISNELLQYFLIFQRIIDQSVKQTKIQFLEFILETEAKIGADGFYWHHVLVFQDPVVPEHEYLKVIDKVYIFHLAVCKSSRFCQNATQIAADLTCCINFVVESLSELKDTEASCKWSVFIVDRVLVENIFK